MIQVTISQVTAKLSQTLFVHAFKLKSSHFSRSVGWNTVAGLLERKVDPRLECSPDVS